MYEILGLIYIGQIVEGLKDICSFIGIFLILTGSFFYIFFKAEYNDDKKLLSIVRNVFIVGIISSLLSVLLPSKDIFYISAGVKASKLVGEENEIANKVIKLIKKKIDEELND